MPGYLSTAWQRKKYTRFMPRTFGAIKAVILDLDDTLYDCSGTLVHSRRLKAAGVIANAIGCSEKEAYQLQNDLDENSSVSGDLYEEIARRYSLPAGFMEEINRKFSEVGISAIKPFAGVTDTLKKLKKDGILLFLVTAGKPEEQEEKVRVLGLDGLFDETTILDTTAVGADAKKACFKEILDSRHLKAEEVLCVGDRMDRELKVAKELGIPTAMVRHGRHYRRFSSNSTGDNEEAPDTYIESVADLPRILDR